MNIKVYVVTAPSACEWRRTLEAAKAEFKIQMDGYGNHGVALYSLEMPFDRTKDPNGDAVDYCETAIAEGKATLLEGEPL